MKTIRLTINGTPHELTVNDWDTLLDVIRRNLGLTGTKKGCGLGEYGACTIIMGGKTVNSCLVLTSETDGKQITTIEGLAEGDKLHPIQQAFIDCGGLQCGFCTPGMIMSTKCLLDSNPNPSEEEIRKAIKGNLCRCTGYVKIIGAIKAAAKNLGCGS